MAVQFSDVATAFPASFGRPGAAGIGLLDAPNDHPSGILPAVLARWSIISQSDGWTVVGACSMAANTQAGQTRCGESARNSSRSSK